jgi:aquaporin Z
MIGAVLWHRPNHEQRRQQQMKAWQKYAAEVLGTFMLVGIGCGAILAVQFSGEPGLVAVSLAFGLGLVVALYTVGEISGGHFNPAVSLAALLDKRIGLVDMIWYWVAQVTGALLASLAFAWVLSRDAVASTYTQINRAAVGESGGVVAEAVFTAIFVLAMLVLYKSDKPIRFLAIGLTLSGVHLLGLVFTGASVNPARTFAPALVGGTWDAFWVFLIGPGVGAVLAWLIYRLVVLGDTDLVAASPLGTSDD